MLCKHEGCEAAVTICYNLDLDHKAISLGVSKTTYDKGCHFFTILILAIETLIISVSRIQCLHSWSQKVLLCKWKEKIRSLFKTGTVLVLTFLPGINMDYIPWFHFSLSFTPPPPTAPFFILSMSLLSFVSLCLSRSSHFSLLCYILKAPFHSPIHNIWSW